MLQRFVPSMLLTLVLVASTLAANEEQYYALVKLPIPEGVVLEGGG